MENKKETKNKEVFKPKQFDFKKNEIKRVQFPPMKPVNFRGSQHRG